MTDKIIIKGARQHNLKNINLEIPKNKMIVFTGISGSGKSSLAFDTIYAEGQRRYVESLSSYARQFLGVMSKPDVDAVFGLSPSISIDQKSSSNNPRSTVGTITEIYDYLRLLYAKIGQPHCPSCNAEITRLSKEEIANKVMEKIKMSLSASGRKQVRFLILSPVVRDRKGEYRELFDRLRMKGYSFVRIDKQIFPLQEDFSLIKTNKHTIETVIDRITVTKQSLKDREKFTNLQSRIFQSVEQALLMSDGLAVISEVMDPAFDFPLKPQEMSDELFSQLFSCPKCNISIAEIEPREFSFNSPHGACPKCTGIGTLLRVDKDRILNLNLSITEGAILPFSRFLLNDTWFGRVIMKVCQTKQINTRVSLKQLQNEKIALLLYGTGEEIYEVEGQNRYGKNVTIYEDFPGIIAELERRFGETESDYVRHELLKYFKKEICPLCQGKRLKKESLAVTIKGENIIDLTQMNISSVSEWMDGLFKTVGNREKEIIKLIVKEINNRLSFLSSVGLDYLTLDRSASTLAGGEMQRIRLASQIGSGLSGVIYVLDEPSIGLHPRDNYRLIKTLKDLRDLGNTVLVVEHDREMMENADYIYDFGPGAGKHGGKVIAQGTPNELKKNPSSITGSYLSNKKKIIITNKRTSNHQKKKLGLLTIKGCTENNLKNIDVSFPLGNLICVTGVSGSGKSSLVVDTLYPALYKHFNPYYKEKVGKYKQLEGTEYIKRAILIDQSPIGRTPRSNPATYSGAFTFIRQLFSMVPEAREKGYGQGRFSFNVKGGRCDACEGEGQIRIEMQFLPDVYVLCDVCKGKRYNSETLDILYKGKNISQVLDMSVEEAIEYFNNIPGLYRKLETLHSVGLSYISLGQSAPQLSGGEAQRVKLASELSKQGVSNTVYILDEPTTGLHFKDLEKLLSVLRELVELQNTVIVIEHNLDVIKNADWVIDLGPEGGDKGGYLIAEGNVEEIIKNKFSYTGRYLKRHG